MDSRFTFLSVAIGACLIIPAVSFAQDAGDGSAGTLPPPPVTVAPPAPPQSPDGALQPMLLRESPTLPSRQGLRESPTLSSGKPLLRESPSKQNARMAASGTRPLPPELEKRLDERDLERGGTTTASGTRMMNGRGEEQRNIQRQKMEERKGEILKRMANQMIGRMKAAIDRLSKLADRVDSRIAKLKSKGVDTTVAEANIAIARTKIAAATSAVSAAESAVLGAAAQADVIASSTVPSDPGKPVREALEKARLAVVDAHKALVDAVESLKANVKTKGDLDENTSEVHATGTSTASTSVAQ